MRARNLLIALLGTGAVAAYPVGSALAGGPAHTAAAKKPFSAHITYSETDHGHLNGNSTVGIVGHGKFSAKLSAHASLAVALVSLATGVPLNKAAEGGTYTVHRSISSKGVGTGLVVASFKAKGLGKLCLGFKFVPGKYNPTSGSGFVPVSGTFAALGGTGAAAKWRGGLSFKETNITGLSVENIAVSGSARPSTGHAKGMSKACRAAG
jgi:hypothetical protein